MLLYTQQAAYLEGGQNFYSFLDKEKTMKAERDIEKSYSAIEFVAKLRRLADAIENNDKFEIQIAGERIYVPVRAEFNIEHEREGNEEEIEFQIKWKNL